MEYLQIRATADSSAARFGNIENYPDKFEMREGIPLAGTFPADAQYRMSPDFPDRIALREFLSCFGSQLVIDQKVKDFFEQEKVEHLEYLPVKVLDHKGRTVKTPYCVANLFPLVDCVDPQKTQHEVNELDDDQWSNVKNLTLRDNAIPLDFQLLRVRYIPSLMLIHRELARKLENAAFRGFETVELSKYRWS